MNKHSSNVRHVKHFLLGAGLVLTLAASTSFAQTLVLTTSDVKFLCGSLGGQMATFAECDAADKAAGKTILPSGEVMKPCAPGQSPSPGNPCAPGGSVPTNLQSGPTTSMPQQSSQPSPPSQPSGPPAFSAQQLESDIASGMLKADTQIPCPSLGNQMAKASDCLNAAKGQASPAVQQQPTVQKPAAEEKIPTVDKSKLSSAKNPAATLAKKGLKNVDKLLNTLSKKFNKQRSKMKKIAVVRSVAKDFMKLCKKYAPFAQDEEFSDEESFTCDEFVADLSEPIAAALKSKDADLAFELTYDALNVNFKELFNSLIQ